MDARYTVLPAAAPPDLQASWDSPAWGAVPALDVAHFRPEGSGHRPPTRCKLLYGPDHLYGHFRVDDRYVRCVHTGFQAPVYLDSCVELFVRPVAGAGYFNFEFNCGGSLLATYVLDPTRVDGRIAHCIPLAPDDDRQILRHASLPERVDPERTEPLAWTLAFAIPLAVLERHAGPLRPLAGQQWRANAYKCGDETSHPHWGAWAPVSAVNFHAPDEFGHLYFAATG